MDIFITRIEFETAFEEVLARPITYLQDFIILLLLWCWLAALLSCPTIKERSGSSFLNATIEAGVDPDVIVAEGAAIQAASMVRFFTHLFD